MIGVRAGAIYGYFQRCAGVSEGGAPLAVLGHAPRADRAAVPCIIHRSDLRVPPRADRVGCGIPYKVQRTGMPRAMIGCGHAWSSFARNRAGAIQKRVTDSALVQLFPQPRGSDKRCRTKNRSGFALPAIARERFFCFFFCQKALRFARNRAGTMPISCSELHSIELCPHSRGSDPRWAGIHSGSAGWTAGTGVSIAQDSRKGASAALLSKKAPPGFQCFALQMGADAVWTTCDKMSCGF